jgi:hypothetical protein
MTRFMETMDRDLLRIGELRFLERWIKGQGHTVSLDVWATAAAMIRTHARAAHRACAAEMADVLLVHAGLACRWPRNRP